MLVSVSVNYEFRKSCYLHNWSWPVLNCANATRVMFISNIFPTPFLQRKRHNLDVVIVGIVLSLCYQIGCPKQTAKKCQNDSADMASTGINTNFCEHVVCRFISLRCFFRSQAIQAPDYQLVLRCQRLPVKAKHFLHASSLCSQRSLAMTTPWSIEFHENILDRSVQARKHKGEESPYHCFVLDIWAGLLIFNEISSVGYPKMTLCRILRSSAFSLLITMLSKVSLVTAVTGSYAKCGTASHAETCPVN